MYVLLAPSGAYYSNISRLEDILVGKKMAFRSLEPLRASNMLTSLTNKISANRYPRNAIQMSYIITTYQKHHL